MPKLTPEQFPFTGPLSRGARSKSPTVIALKRAMSRMGFLPWTKFDPVFNLKLEQALDAWDSSGANGYGLARWEKIRSAKVPQSLPHAGELALDSIAIALVQDEVDPLPTIPFVYPHPAGSGSHSGGFIHQTEGFPEPNIALDFLTAGGTALLAPFAGLITKLGGHDPATGTWRNGRPDPRGDVFGYSIYLEREDGLFAFMTHIGRESVRKGQEVEAGEKIGEVGHWPGDPGRSHTHLGITSPRGTRDATDVLLKIAAAPRVEAL